MDSLNRIRAFNSEEHMHRLDIAIHIEDLTVSFGSEPALWDIDMEVPKGVLMAIIGPNGAGKSTVLKSILGLVKPQAGRIFLFGKAASLQKKLIAYVPQKSSIDWDFPVSALDVVLMGLYQSIGWIRRPKKTHRQIALDALRMVGMEDLKNRQIGELSGGQQQRVFIARALVQNAEIFLMDEPFQGVDQTTEKTIINILRNLRDNGKTVVVVHHDLQTVPEYFDWAFMLNVRTIAVGTVKDVFNEENLRYTYGGKSGFLSLEKSITEAAFQDAAKHNLDHVISVGKDVDSKSLGEDIIRPQTNITASGSIPETEQEPDDGDSLDKTPDKQPNAGKGKVYKKDNNGKTGAK